MKKKPERRVFIGRIAALVLSGVFLGSCFSREKKEARDKADPGDQAAPRDKAGRLDKAAPGDQAAGFEAELAKNRQMPRDLVIKMLDQKVDQHMQRSHHCAQSSFLALQEQFGLDGDQVVKALTPLPGLAERGETCGALTGPLMALGLVYGRNEHQMGNWDAYQKSLVPAGQFFDRFKGEFGTTTCHGVQTVKFGTCFQLTDPEQLQEFQNAGATEHCSEVVRTAVRMAAGIILEDASL